MSFEVVKTSIVGLFVLFIIIIIGGSFMLMVDHIKPIVDDLQPVNNTEGMTTNSYNTISDNLENTLKIIFYLAIGGLMSFIVIKILFEKESTSSYY